MQGSFKFFYISKSVVFRKHQNILVKEKIGYENLYTVRDEDRAAKMLIAYKPSFLDKLVDRTLET